MNEQDNTAAVKALYAAFGRGDIQYILERLTSDIEWTLEGPAILPFAGTMQGPDGVLTFFQALATTQDDRKLTIDTIVAQGDMVATMGRYAATVKATGKRFDSAVAHFFTFRNGKVAKFNDFVNTALMAEAYQQAAAASR
ncbi:MAG TPA: nuclear transport factor 2 family protein [Bryobacteraceae bacterium]|nr:nuclear transport factor 2 family protein [Bryobacteraceae bacterium]